MRIFLVALLALAFGPVQAPPEARAQTPFEITVTPSTLRSSQARLMALPEGARAIVTCEPGDYPAWLRGGAGAAGFKAQVTYRCAGSTFPGGTVAGARNLTWQGGTFTGRVIVASFENVTFQDMLFPKGSGVQARNGRGLVVRRLQIQSSGAAIALGNVTDALIADNVVLDFSGNAAIGAYGGGDITIRNNVVEGHREVAKGVHPDAIQTANAQTGTVTVTGNWVRWKGQGIFLGGTPDRVVITDNDVMVDAPNGIAWKSREPATVCRNVLRKLPNADKAASPRMINYGERAGQARAAGGCANEVLGRTVRAK